MGIVYEALQPVIEKRVAIKVIRPDAARDEKGIQRFLEEARTSTSIRHRAIVDVFNFGQLPDGRPYMVMEYLNGVSLDELICEKGPLSISECLWILDEVLSALIAAHRSGVIHRDLKPSNIFIVIEPSSASRYTKLLDFGIAKLSKRASEDTWHTSSAAEGVLGTVDYMAPEQLRAEAIGPRTDLYALGCVAYEMLTGHPPFMYETAAQVAAAHLEKVPERLAERRPEVPKAVDDFVFTLLAKRPEDRPRSSRAAREALKSLRTDLGLVRWDLSHETNEPKSEEDFDAATYVRGSAEGKKLRRSRPRLLAALGGCCIIAAAAVPLFRLVGFHRTASASSPPGQEPSIAESRPPAPRPDPPVEPTVKGSDVTNTFGVQHNRPLAAGVPVVAASLPAAPLKAPSQRHKRAKPVNVRADDAADTPTGRPRMGYLSIDATPWAHVKINGRYIRDTPIADYAVREGAVTIELENPERGKRTLKRFVKAGRRESVSERFE
jgi:serine/threonine-protein kinase